MNSEKLQKWALAAEIVGGIAVVISIITLIISIRENTETTRVSMYERNIDSLNQWRSEISTNPEVATIWFQLYRNIQIDDFSDIDYLRAIMITAELFAIYEKSYFANRAGYLGESEWSRFETQICINYETVKNIANSERGFNEISNVNLEINESYITKALIPLGLTLEFSGFIDSFCD